MDREQNPYAPPVESADAYDHPPERGSLSLSGQGWDIVTGMAKWMRVVSTLLYVGGALWIVSGLGAASCGTSLASQLGHTAAYGAVAAALLVLGVLFLLGATWLRQAATHFYDGVLADAEQPLAQGFRKFRLFLILYGVYAVVGLVLQLLGLFLKGEG